MHEYDVTLVTQSKFVKIESPSRFEQCILEDDALVRAALEAKGLRVYRTNWDDKNFDWCKTKYIFIRSPWDYFRRFDEFCAWLNDASSKTKFINTIEIIRWNIDKHYLLDLQREGLRIPPTVFIEKGDQRTLAQIAGEAEWKDFILKPAVSGAAYNTYKFGKDGIKEHEAIYSGLIANEAMLLQEFQYNILDKGEVALMVFGGKYSHAVLKRAKEGDFRVQDDFGGTVHDYIAAADEIEFAERAASLCKPVPAYARVDVMWDNTNRVCISELEVIEPELWFRKNPNSAKVLAQIISEYFRK